MSIRMLTGLVVASVGAVASADVSSTFDSDAEGWGILNDATPLAWEAATGNPGGAISASDLRQGPIWYFAASGDYLGDRSLSFGQELSWDIRGVVGSQTSVTNRADVILSGGGMTIGLDADVLPQLGAWTSWSATLGGAGWRSVNISSGALSGGDVSQSDIANVLSNLTALYIRGEYTNGSDASRLDNVLLRAVPTPGAALVLGVAGIAGTRRRR